MNEAPSDGNESSRMFSLKSRSSAWMTSHAASALPDGMNVNGNGGDVDEFLWQIIRTKTDGETIDVRATDTVFQCDMFRVTPQVVNGKENGHLLCSYHLLWRLLPLRPCESSAESRCSPLSDRVATSP